MSERYLAIEGIRLEDRLVLKVDISDDVLGQYLHFARSFARLALLGI